MELGLKGKTILITGSTSGIGKASAEIFASEGADVIITGRNCERAEKTAEMIRRKYRVRAEAVISDLTVEGAVEELYEEVSRRSGVPDILVNSAGAWPASYVTDMEKDEFEKTVYLNLEVPYILSRMLVNDLLSRDKKGKIIHVVSQAAFHGSTSGHAHYAAAKAGLVAFMISQAREVAANGININAVAPGIVRTKMIQEKLDKDPDQYLTRIPVGRVAEPEEIAHIIAFLASEKADYLTGITVDATGGMLMR